MTSQTETAKIHKMKKIISITIFLLTISILSNLLAGKIVYPWRSTTAIVKVGETFEVWFKADAGQTINGIELQSKYLNVTPSISNSINQTWVYDKWSENTCNIKLTVTIPANTPADRYNLVLKTSTGDETSLAAVNVIKDYKTNFYIFHISDAHRWQGSYDALKILKMVATTIDIANIINPEIVLETGDNHYPNTNNPASTNQRTNDYYNGFMNGTEYVNGLNNFSAPVFSVPGNHDTPQKNYELEPGYPAAGYTKVPSQYYNEFYGLQAHNFSYGNARFIGLNNAWFSDESTGIPNFTHQTEEAKAWLNKVGKGTFRIGYCHVMTPTPLKAFYDPLYKADAPLNLILAGHCHWAGNTHSIKDYPNVKITHTGYPLRELHRKAAFNLYKVDLLTNKYTAIGDSIGVQEGLAIADDFTSVKLKLTYNKANDGSNPDNIATIVNKFNFPIPGAHVRFVVPKGNKYYVKNATIIQEFDGTNFHIIDATYDLEANSTTVVTLHQGIQVDLCPDDPDKMDPGICGCGVPEGSCPIDATDIILNASTVRLVLNTTRQLKATILPTKTTNKTINWLSSDQNVASVNSEGNITALSEGNATITATTFDGAKSTTSTITVLPATNIYQAEDAEFVGPLAVSNQPGYNGAGFVDYTNTSNDYIKWNVYVPAEGVYSLTFRYSLASNNRPLKLSINDIVKVASLSFPITGAWSTWNTFATNQTLVEGSNSIMLTAIGSSGGNFDELTISGNGISALRSVKSGSNGRTVKIYPNPLRTNKLSIEMLGFESENQVQVKITNLLGQTVLCQTVNNTSRFEINTLNLLNKSIYTVSVESGDSRISNLLILN